MVDLKISLPDNFLEEEVRCGYVITTKMKEIWAVEIDLLCEFIRVCKKHDIQFYADGGTAIGCVRHGGFIPWDDDIDLAVGRDEYNRLCDVSYEFEYPYYFQTEQTDPGVLRGHIQIRNSETTAILSEELNYKFKYNQGIFIDIFPKDNIPDNDEEFEAYIKEIFKIKDQLGRYKRILLVRDPVMYNFSFKKGIKNLVKNICSPVVKVLYRRKYQYYEKLMCKYKGKKTKRVCNIPVSIKRNYKRCISPADFLYNKPINFKFEFIELPVPSNYDEVLRATYGDYMEFVIGNNTHGGIIFDTCVSYREFLKRLIR